MVVDSDERKRSPFLYLFVAYALAVPAITGAAIHYESYHSLIPAALYGVQMAVFGGGILLLVIWSRAAHRARIKRRQERRKTTGQRSPWGARRDREPSPYSDRLATFLIATESDEPQTDRHALPEVSCNEVARSHTFSSRMPFCSILDLPQDSNEPKPPWIIRRILTRIREAVASQAN